MPHVMHHSNTRQVSTEMTVLNILYTFSSVQVFNFATLSPPYSFFIDYYHHHLRFRCFWLANQKFISVFSNVWCSKCWMLVLQCFRLCFSKLHQEERMSAYKDFCKSMEMQSLEACLMTDLRVWLSTFDNIPTVVMVALCNRADHNIFVL